MSFRTWLVRFGVVAMTTMMIKSSTSAWVGSYLPTILTPTCLMILISDF